jgi:predicted NAD/FAD-binding protein|tara:strand:- start:8660 stop:9931 length:1272 start_codon:yes stop_codon:yes gene_type:complete
MKTSRKKIAVIGGGISGLGAAYLLKDATDLTLFEKNAYLGGHSRTLEVEVSGKTVPVDTGFIVYNERNYPLLTGLFRHLEVPVVESNMSFGVSINDGWLEFSSGGLQGLFGSIRNLTNPKMWRLVSDILKFNRGAMKYLEAPGDISLGQCLDEIGVSDWFRYYYILPMGGSIWSCPVEQILNFPAAAFLRFFNNHGLLTVADQPQWYSVVGGSKEYVNRLIDQFSGQIKIRSGAKSVSRISDGVQVTDETGEVAVFDEVIIAAHADEALKLNETPTPDEEEILSAFKYQPNEVILHTDDSFMPKRRSAWASWIYSSEEKADRSYAISLSYWMNNLQALDTDTDVFVTLNPGKAPAEKTILNRHIFDHPVFDQASIEAQKRIEEIQGKDRVWYCGAYQRNGFHEDGLWSAVRVAEKMGITPSWI